MFFSLLILCSFIIYYYLFHCTLLSFDCAKMPNIFIVKHPNNKIDENLWKSSFVFQRGDDVRYSLFSTVITYSIPTATTLVVDTAVYVSFIFLFSSFLRVIGWWSRVSVLYVRLLFVFSYFFEKHAYSVVTCRPFFCTLTVVLR